MNTPNPPIRLRSLLSIVAFVFSLAAAAPAGAVNDGTSNTIIISDGPNRGSGGGGTITDGSSNTIDLGETPPHTVPDGTATLLLFVGAVSALVCAHIRRRR